MNYLCILLLFCFFFVFLFFFEIWLNFLIYDSCLFSFYFVYMIFLVVYCWNVLYFMIVVLYERFKLCMFGFIGICKMWLFVLFSNELGSLFVLLLKINVLLCWYFLFKYDLFVCFEKYYNCIFFRCFWSVC